MYALRLATRADVPALHALITESVRALSVGFYDAAVVEASLAHVLSVDTQLIDDGTYFVAEGDAEALAAAGGWSGRRTLFGGDSFKGDQDRALDPAREPARIRAFYVHPAHARRGLGRKLFRACAAAAWDAGFRRLELVATLPGEQLYRALGFERLDPVTVPLPGGLRLTGWHMARALTAADAGPAS